MGMTHHSDVELIARARAGHDDAFAELYDRHAPAAHRLAATFPRAGSADDLVHGAFERVLGAIKRGAGPDESFRAYLFVTLRRLAAAQVASTHDEPVDEVPEGLRDEETEVIDLSERTIVLDAYGSLPDRMQAVLWQTEVEGRPPRELAPVLGMTANATAALASRAREKLRQAYLQAHLHASPHPQCEPHRSRLGSFVRDDVSDRARTATAAHVDGCRSCQALVAELAEVNSLFARALLPYFAQPAQVAVAAATGAAGAAGVAGAAGGPSGGALTGARQFGQGVVSKARANPVVSGAVVVASALAAAALAISTISGDAPVGGPAAPAQAEVSAPSAPSEPPSPPTTSPATTTPSTPPVTRAPARQADPPVTAITPTTRAGVVPDAAPTPAPATTAPAPAATAPPPPTPPSPAEPPEPPPTPPLGPVVWLPDEARVQITLTNGGGERSGFLVLDLEALGGATVSGRPSGCALGLAVGTTGLCGLPPLRPGETAVVTVPVTTTGPGQTARVTVCSAAILRLDCDTLILTPTTVALD